MKISESQLVKISLLLFAVGCTGILFSSYDYQIPGAESIFILCSLSIGACLLLYLFINMRNTKARSVFLSLLFLASIIKVAGILVKYGIFLGADAFSEYGVINHLMVNGFLPLQSSLAEFPLSMIGVSSLSMATGLPPIVGVWNLIDLVSAALIPVFVFLIFNQHFSERISLLASLFVAYHPTNTIFGMSMTRENFALLLLCIAIYIISMQMNNKIRPEYVPVFLIVTVSFIGSHYTSAYYGVMVITVLGLLCLILYFLRKWRGLRQFYVIIPVMILFLWWSNTIIHLSDLGTAKNFLTNMWEFLTFQSPALREPVHYEIAWIASKTDLLTMLYLVQVLILVVGSVWFIILIIRRRLSYGQMVFASLAIALVALDGIWFLIPELSGALFLSRILRYTILFNSIAAGFFVASLLDIRLIRRKRVVTRNAIRMLVCLAVLVILVFPISAELTKYIGFTDAAYPAELENETYNIRSMTEIGLLGFVASTAPDGAPVVLEFPFSNALSLYQSSCVPILMKKEMLLDPSPGQGLTILRRSLLEYGQYIYYPENWQLAGPYVDTLSDKELVELRHNVWSGSIVYDKGLHKIWYD